MNKWSARASAIILSGLSGSLASCNQSTPATERATAPPVAADTAARPLPPAPVPTADTTDWMAYRRLASPSDTSLLINGQRYRLLVSAAPDSSRKLKVTFPPTTKTSSADDSTGTELPLEVTGVDVVLRFVLLNAQGRQVFRRELWKKDFSKAVSPDILIPSGPEQPEFIGYSPALKGFAFQLPFVIPDSDVGSYAFLLLGFNGQIHDLSYSNELAVDRNDCEPQTAPNGKALLTCTQLLLPGQKSISLLKPKSQVVMSRFLSDSTLLVVYAYGEYQDENIRDAHGNEPTGFVEPPQMRQVPNAFVLNLRGWPITSFRYDGYTNELGYTVPRRYLAQTHMYYLLDEKRGLRLLNKHQPTTTREIRFRQMARFKPPQKPREIRFHLIGMGAEFDFYVDQDHPTHIRYRKVGGE